jgi:hypothetical protein
VTINKREIRREFKERVNPKGVFAVRCKASGETWVSFSRDLKASETGLWFGLRIGGHINKALQTAWNTHGAEAFTFEVIETFPEDTPAMLLKDMLRDRQKHWQRELGARPV